MPTAIQLFALSGLVLASAACSAQHDSPKDDKKPASPAAAAPSTPPATPAAAPLDWKTLEAPLLVNHVQLTSRDRFVKAGEAYFDHQTPPRWVIFQAVSALPAVDPATGNSHEAQTYYGMYVAKLLRDESGRITGADEPVRISPEGSSDTCGWFHPTIPYRVLFGGTLTPPANNEKAGIQVGSRKYVWMFPSEMDVVWRDVQPILTESPNPPEIKDGKPVKPAGWSGALTRLFPGADGTPAAGRPNYDAECSWSKDGRFVLYAHVRDEPTRGRPDADIWIYDTRTGKQHEIVHGDGYDGGPFFSPDNKMICYRSDRRGDDLLQLFVSELKFDAEGVPVGIAKEHQVTDDQAVNWAPYWHPSGKYLLYGSSTVSHANYEVFAVEVDLNRPAAELRKRRITHADGADVLPVFSDDGKLMMWTGQRGPKVAGEEKPSSQLWLAEVKPGPGGLADPEGLFADPAKK